MGRLQGSTTPSSWCMEPSKSELQRCRNVRKYSTSTSGRKKRAEDIFVTVDPRMNVEKICPVLATGPCGGYRRVTSWGEIVLECNKSEDRIKFELFQTVRVFGIMPGHALSSNCLGARNPDRDDRDRSQPFKSHRESAIQCNVYMLSL